MNPAFFNREYTRMGFRGDAVSRSSPGIRKSPPSAASTIAAAGATSSSGCTAGCTGSSSSGDKSGTDSRGRIRIADSLGTLRTAPAVNDDRISKETSPFGADLGLCDLLVSPVGIIDLNLTEGDERPVGHSR